MSATPHSTSLIRSQYEGLRFSFAEMEREIENMRQLAKRFLERPSFESVIRDWQRQLSIFKSRSAGSSIHWSIPETDPIQTIVSLGAYEPSGRRGRAVFGQISGSWEIRIPQITGKRRGGTQKSFILLGLASTKITIWAYHKDKKPEEIALWTVEIGDATSPGCHFHTQITLEDAGNKFPGFLSVPRLPGLLLTPMDALEFLLAELFQEEWYKHSSRGNDALRHWASCQRNRLMKLLKWQLEKINEASGSPWTTFKRQKPPLDMFFNESTS